MTQFGYQPSVRSAFFPPAGAHNAVAETIRERRRREEYIRLREYAEKELRRRKAAERAAIARWLYREQGKVLALRDVVAQVAAEFGVSVLDIKSERRGRHLCKARLKFYWRAARETKHSYPEIGRFCGGRDHTTVLYGIRVHEKRMAKEGRT